MLPWITLEMGEVVSNDGDGNSFLSQLYIHNIMDIDIFPFYSMSYV